MPAAVMGVSCYLLLSCLGFAITVQAQSCSRPVGGPNMALKDTDILLQTFPDGTKVSFACNVGYVSAGGSPSITCTAGSWSTVRLKCERYNCGAFPEVMNGQVHYPEDTEFGSKVEITCNEGYQLVGKNEIFCGAEGWMGRPPTCEVLSCEPPRAIVNGSFSPIKDSYEYAEIVQYRCRNDLELIGQNTLTCGENGEFQPNPPTCRYVECPDLVIPNGEWISGSRPPHKHKATVTYRCKAGFTMSGPDATSTLICESNSQWSPAPPTCEAIPTTAKATTTTTLTTTTETTTASIVTCKPPRVEHSNEADHLESSYRVASTVTLSCKDGYKMKGEATQTCDRNGHWSPGLPKCELPIVRCKAPFVENTEGIDLLEPSYSVGYKTTLRCVDGYSMKGEETQTCDANGLWSPGLPECERDFPVVAVSVGVPCGLVVAVAVAAGAFFFYKKKKQGPKGRDPGNATTDPAEKLELQSA